MEPSPERATPLSVSWGRGLAAAVCLLLCLGCSAESGGDSLISVQMLYRIELDDSSCLDGVSFGGDDKMTEWLVEGVRFTVVAEGVRGHGLLGTDSLELTEIEVADVQLEGCVADGSAAEDAGRALSFLCVRDGASCGLAFTADPHCGRETVPALAAVGFDLAAVQKVSRFNSCIGHGYGCSLRDACPSALKLYLVIDDELAGRNDVFPLSAPCAGEVIERFPEFDTLPCYDGDNRGDQLRLRCDDAESLEVVLFHVNVTADVQPGTRFSAGAPVGFADTRGCGGAGSVDVVVGFPGCTQFPFDYMSDTVLADWAAWGLEDPWTQARLTDEERGICDFAEPAPKDHWFMP